MPKSEELSDSYEEKLMTLRAEIFKSFDEKHNEVSLKEMGQACLLNYMRWKWRKWKAITKIESTKMRNSILILIENEEIICKICAKTVIAKNIKEHSLLCKSRAENILTIKEKVDLLKNELLVWLFEDRRKISLENLILK